MKTVIVAGLLTITSVAAMADYGNSETWGQDTPNSGVSRTRVEVVAELREAQANNTIAYGEHAAPTIAVPSASTLTRRQVLDEVAAMRKAGQLPLHGDYSRSRGYNGAGRL